MIELLFEILKNSFLGLGALAILIGSIGVLRFPDFYSRVHAAGVTETAGIGFIFAGLFIDAGLTLVSVKLFFILLFMLITGPTASHALAKAARHGNLVPYSNEGGNSSSN